MLSVRGRWVWHGTRAPSTHSHRSWLCWWRTAAGACGESVGRPLPEPPSWGQRSCGPDHHSESGEYLTLKARAFSSYPRQCCGCSGTLFYWDQHPESTMMSQVARVILAKGGSQPFHTFIHRCYWHLPCASCKHSSRHWGLIKEQTQLSVFHSSYSLVGGVSEPVRYKKKSSFQNKPMDMRSAIIHSFI